MIGLRRLCLYTFPLNRTARVPPPQLEVKFRPIQKGDPATEQVIQVVDPELVEQRFNRGEICFAALHQGKIVSYCWLARGEVGIEEIHLAVKPQADEIYLYNAMTLRPWRGHGLYPALLGEIVSYARTQGFSRALIFVSSTNRASHRGVTKAGFVKCQIVTYLNILGFSFYWQSQPSEDQRPVVFTHLRGGSVGPRT